MEEETARVLGGPLYVNRMDRQRGDARRRLLASAGAGITETDSWNHGRLVIKPRSRPVDV
jgi:hypothetical protein